MGATNPPWRLNQADQSGEPRRAARRDAQLDARLSFLLPALEPTAAIHNATSYNAP
ncbi:MAG: hypothetical protein QOG00_840, partial [Pyrinomonadaceae bacterium]|nr:hypothetical protein [Pyrinomonadaceae bacterium]